MNDTLEGVLKYFYYDLFDPEFTSTNLVHKTVLSFVIIVIALSI